MNEHAEPVKLLFLCTGNSCRSQMAEAWAKAVWQDNVRVWSAGTAVHAIDPHAVRVMEEAGISMGGHTSTPVSRVLDIGFDYVITVCDNARETCPVFPRPVRALHRSFDDPPLVSQHAKTEQERLDIYRRVRDQIRDFILGLHLHIKELQQPPPSPWG